MKVGQSSTALVLDKDWVDNVKSTLGADEITVNVFGKTFLLVEIVGLTIKDEKDKKIINLIKKHLSKIKKVE